MPPPEAGWERRIITDREKARELGDIYRSVGFDVRIVVAIPEDFADSCAPCPLVQAGAFQIVYTRRRDGDHQ